MTSGEKEQSKTRPPAAPSRDTHLWEITWVRDCFLIAMLVILVWSVLWLRAIFQPLLLALLFAYLINPVVVWCVEKTNRSRLVCVSVLFAVTILVVMSIGFFIIPIALQQAEQLATKLPEYVDAMASQSGIKDEVVRDTIREKGAAFMKDPVSSLSYLWDGVATGVGFVRGFLGTATSVIMGVTLFPLYLFFFSWKWPAIAAWPDRFIPASHRDRVEKVAGKMDQAVGDYFRTRMLIAVIMGISYSVGWGIAGVPYWLLVGMLGGLLGIIPYAASIAWLAAMMLRYLELDNGISGTADAVSVFVWPTLVFSAVQASDDWLLTPWLQGRQFDMSFVTIMLSVLVGGAVAGLLGMLLAVPFAACVRILWAEVVGPILVEYAETH